MSWEKFSYAPSHYSKETPTHIHAHKHLHAYSTYAYMHACHAHNYLPGSLHTQVRQCIIISTNNNVLATICTVNHAKDTTNLCQLTPVKEPIYYDNILALSAQVCACVRSRVDMCVFVCLCAQIEIMGMEDCIATLSSPSF